jgi:carboxypeptidase C (cathepsin A)
LQGHLLPMDQPAVALDMIDRFINQENFDDFPLPNEGL